MIDYKDMIKHHIKPVESLKYENSIFKQQADDITNQLANNMERQISAIEEIAKSSNEMSTIAKKKATRADIKGWIAIFISLGCLIIEFIVHNEKIVSYFIP